MAKCMLHWPIEIIKSKSCLGLARIEKCTLSDLFLYGNSLIKATIKFNWDHQADWWSISDDQRPPACNFGVCINHPQSNLKPSRAAIYFNGFSLTIQQGFAPIKESKSIFGDRSFARVSSSGAAQFVVSHTANQVSQEGKNAKAPSRTEFSSHSRRPRIIAQWMFNVLLAFHE